MLAVLGDKATNEVLDRGVRLGASPKYARRPGHPVDPGLELRDGGVGRAENATDDWSGSLKANSSMK